MTIPMRAACCFVRALMSNPMRVGALGLAFAGAAHAGGDRDLAAHLRASGDEMERFDPDAIRPEPLSVSVLLQTRYMFDARDAALPPNSENYTQGFDMPRAEVRLRSNIFNSQLMAYLAFDFGDAEGDRGRGRLPSTPAGGGSPQLREAYAQYNFEGRREGVYLRVGQFRSSVLTEDAIAPEFQTAVARSLATEFLSLGLTQGVVLGKVDQSIAWEVSLNDGGRTWGIPEPANTPFNSALEADWGASLRIDYKLAGDWERFADFASWRGSDEAFKIGFGFHAQQTGATNPVAVAPDMFVGTTTSIRSYLWTVDAQYEGDGWSAFAAYQGNYLGWGYVPVGLVAVQHGLVLQGNMFLGDQVEVFGRFDWLRIDGEISTGFGTQGRAWHVFTAGANWYMIPESHAVKFTADVVYTGSGSATLDTGAPGGNSNFFPDPGTTGMIGASAWEVLVRAQLQVLF